MHGRETRAGYGIGDRFPRVRKQHVRAVNGQHRLDLGERYPADPEYAGLRRFDQEQRLVAVLRRDRDREHAFEHGLLDLLAAAAQTDFDLGRFLGRERLRRSRVFEREVLEVDLFDSQRRSAGSLLVSHALSSCKGRVAGL